VRRRCRLVTIFPPMNRSRCGGIFPLCCSSVRLERSGQWLSTLWVGLRLSISEWWFRGRDPCGSLVIRGGHVRSDDRLEYEWLFRAAYPRILRTVSQIVGDRAAAEDVTQEAFLKLLQHWRTASGYEQPDAWVRRVAIRLAVRQAKRELRRPHVERQPAPMSGSGGTPDADLAEAIMRLSPMQRAAVVLFYFDDQPVKQIARALVVSESTVKQHLHRARLRIADLLREEVHEDVD